MARQRLTGEILFVDGYNIMNAWPELIGLQRIGLDAARDGLLERMADYCGYLGSPVVVVFDAHMTPEPEHAYREGLMEVVFTAPGMTADQYIERQVGLLRNSGLKIRVASSDALIQGTVMGFGALRISAREFLIEVTARREKEAQARETAKPVKTNLLDERLRPEMREKLERMRKEKS